MTWGSTVPDAIGALYAATSAEDALPGVMVTDGPKVTSDAATQVLTIGYPGGDEDVAAEVSASPDGWDSRPDRESYSISCAASVANGDGDLAAARVAAYAIVNGVGGILAADQTLGGIVLRARLGSSTLHQSQTKRGAVVTVSFTVAVDAFTQR